MKKQTKKITKNEQLSKEEIFRALLEEKAEAIEVLSKKKGFLWDLSDLKDIFGDFAEDGEYYALLKAFLDENGIGLMTGEEEGMELENLENHV